MKVQFHLFVFVCALLFALAESAPKQQARRNEKPQRDGTMKKRMMMTNMDKTAPVIDEKVDRAGKEMKRPLNKKADMMDKKAEMMNSKELMVEEKHSSVENVDLEEKAIVKKEESIDKKEQMIKESGNNLEQEGSGNGSMGKKGEMMLKKAEIMDKKAEMMDKKGEMMHKKDNSMCHRVNLHDIYGQFLFLHSIICCWLCQNNL